ncbi:MAG TPA: T9SS-dependent M36 family metallopeptidase [Aequorivita sp.]|nr:T9SS-dependent M36 family metallopeptidase [Aequorivita sp.]
MKKLLSLIIFFAVNISIGQDFSGIIESYLQQNQEQLQLEKHDIADVSISSQSFSKSLNAYNIYVDQNYRGIKVYNSVSSFAVKNNQVVSAALSFAQDISSKVNSTTPSISATAAIAKATSKLGVSSPTGLNLLETVSDYSYIFNDGNISLENIPVELVYQSMNEGKTLKLAWDLSIYLLDGSHYYSVRVDALTGDLLQVHDWVYSCDFGEGPHSHAETESVLFSNAGESVYAIANNATPKYRVFPLPLIGPNEGSDQLVTDPSDPTASPYGWHDTDGMVGHEYTSTRGNNVLAKDDLAGNNYSGSQAEGGAEMLFDFDFGLPQHPANFTNGAITHLFYMNNVLHDIFYLYGFDEASGNFQQNNYGRGGNAGDYVIADAQDGGGMNNANFAVGTDGVNGRMQMYLWSSPGQVLGTYLTVNDGPLEGAYYANTAQFSDLPEIPVTADLALLSTNDDTYLGCDSAVNASELNGKIAVVRRGDCAFVDKTLNAQEAGAVGLIIVNNESADPIVMGGDEPNINIPAILVYQRDGEDIISALLDGQTINATMVDDGSGTDTNQRDGDLDNAIVAHEYGHGVSIRLTGGRFNPGCLRNDEQMGEGWSDYFALALTMKPGDRGEDVRGMGTYSQGQGVGGTGIRSKPYSTDFAVNNFTYNSIKTQWVPHGVGSVWATMLWDLTWAFVDEYGFDPDVYEGEGGNNMALQLVMDGLKLQPCSPGFVDGRDAILEADEIANGGANKCLIWHAFARRGLGFSATQGNTNSKTDGVQAFDVPEDCALGVGSQDSINNKFVVYPNPSNGELNIHSRFDVQEAEITIFDMNGRKVFGQEVELHQAANVDASGLNPGIYMVQIEGGGFSQTTKLIIK